jgi:hypothetical protein
MCVAGEKVEVFFFPPKNYEMRLETYTPTDRPINLQTD